MAQGLRLLVVDQSTETTDVLRAVLEPRGVAVERSRSLPALSADHPSPRIDLLVVDEDSAAWSGAVDANPDVPRIVIGTIGHAATPGATDRRLPKPFHYVDLMREIEAMIANRAAETDRAASARRAGRRQPPERQTQHSQTE